MLFAIEVIIGIVVLIAIALTIFIFSQGKENVIFLKDKRTKAHLVSKSDERIDFAFDVPYENPGKDDGVFLDAYVRVYLPDEQYNGALLRGKVNRSDVPRDDDYFEAMLVPIDFKGALTVKFELTPRNGKATAAEALLGMPDVEFALYVDERGRENLYRAKTNILITKEELQALLA